MPRLDQRVMVEGVFSYEQRMMMTILVEQLNVLRAHLDLPLLTPQDLRQDVRAYVRAHPRGEV